MAFDFFWDYVVIVCIFVFLVETFNILDVYFFLWKESFGEFSDYKVENGKYVINVWYYFERMGIYKILLNKIVKYFEKFVFENE